MGNPSVIVTREPLCDAGTCRTNVTQSPCPTNNACVGDAPNANCESTVPIDACGIAGSWFHTCDDQIRSWDGALQRGFTERIDIPADYRTYNYASVSRTWNPAGLPFSFNYVIEGCTLTYRSTNTCGYTTTVDPVHMTSAVPTGGACQGTQTCCVDNFRSCRIARIP